MLSASAVNPLNSALPPVTPNANSTVDITKALPDLSISKTASKAEVRKGNSFSYKVVVQNNSTTTTQHSVKVTDSIPQGLDVTSVSRTRINTAGSSTATTGVIAWDNFYGSANSAGTGWSGNW